MPYNLRNGILSKRSPIPSFQNFVRCGNPKCKISCNDNRLFCEGCQKWFHYFCNRVSRKKFLEITKKKWSYVCDEACYAKLLPFHGVGHNDLLLNFNTLNLYPCNTCKEDCLDSSKMDCIQCDVCCKWYHSDCAPNMSYSFETYVEKKYLKYFCHIKCELSFLPFYLMKILFFCELTSIG